MVFPANRIHTEQALLDRKGEADRFTFSFVVLLFFLHLDILDGYADDADYRHKAENCH